MRRREPAFTMVELLVVMGLIGVLMAILVPVLGRAREAARTAICATNLRLLQQACTNYAADNRGYLPPAHIDFITKNLHRWHGVRSSGSQPFDFSASPLKKYLQIPVVKKCPSFEPDATGFEQSAGGYGYNNRYLGSSMEESMPSGIGILFKQARYFNVPAKLPMIGNPSRTVMFTDAAMATPAFIEYSFVEPPLAGGSKTSPSMHFRHSGKANVVWVDGHVTSQAMEWTYPPASPYWTDNTRAHLGFFGPKDNSLFDRL